MSTQEQTEDPRIVKRINDMKARFLESTSNLLGRLGFARALGLSFEGQRDYYKVFGYKRVLTFEDYYLKYKRQGTARRIIDAPVNATWADPPMLDGGDAFNTKWKEITNNTQLWHTFIKADTFCGIGAFAGILIGLDDGKELDQPVTQSASRKITYLQPYMEASLQISEYETDPKNPRFGRPTMYTVSPGRLEDTNLTNVTGAAKMVLKNALKVHWTRFLHLADNTGENPVLGSSRLECVFNNLDDLLKVLGGSAETYWLAGNRGLHVDVDKEMELEKDDADDLADEIDEYQHQLRRVIRTRGVKINNLGSDLADPTGTYNTIMSEMAASTGIPKRVLMGSEAGQLASQQDRANWADRMKERAANFAGPVMLLPFIGLLIQAGVLPQPTELKITWPDAYKMSPYESAQTSAQMARSMANVSKAMQTWQTMGVLNAFSLEECRLIVSFGKHQPIFDSKPSGSMIPKAPVTETANTGGVGDGFGNTNK